MIGGPCHTVHTMEAAGTRTYISGAGAVREDGQGGGRQGTSGATIVYIHTLSLLWGLAAMVARAGYGLV